MLGRISLVILLLTIINGSGSLILERIDDSIVLTENPLQVARELIYESRMEEAMYLVSFSQRYLSKDSEYSDIALENDATQALISPMFLFERFATGALTGEVSDTTSLLGSLTLDLLVIGDIRDLLVQGYKELDSGQGDEVIMGLSTVGLLLTLAPELSWAPSLFKTFWRGRRVSEPFQKQITKELSKARRTGDYGALKRMMSEFTEVVEGLGAGPAMSIFKQVETSEDLALLATKAKIAPMESYTLSSINGIKALGDISTTGAKQGKLIKRVKIVTRQQKIFSKLLGLVPLYLLLGIFVFCMAIFVLVISRSRKQLAGESTAET